MNTIKTRDQRTIAMGKIYPRNDENHDLLAKLGQE